MFINEYLKAQVLLWVTHKLCLMVFHKISCPRVMQPKFENLRGVKQSKKQLSSGHLAAAVICQARVIHCRVLLKTEGGGVMSAKTRHCAVAERSGEKLNFAPQN